MICFVFQTGEGASTRSRGLLGPAMVATVLLLLMSSPSLAGGILHFLPCYEDGHPVPLERAVVVSSRARVVVSDTELEYVYDQTFLNNNDHTVDCIYMLPYDAASPPHTVSVTINGAPTALKPLPPDQSLQMLFQLTRDMGDPSLLELAGKAVFVVSHLRLGARKEKFIQVRLVEKKRVSADFMGLFVPMWGERYSLGPVAGFEIFVRFKMSFPIRAVLSPTHEIFVSREAPHRATISVKSQNRRVKNDLIVLAVLRGADFDARVFCQRTSDLEGVFMAILTPPLADKGQKALPKDVVFALDISGSVPPAMREFSQQVLMSGVRRLGNDDRFNIVTIGTRIGIMHKGLVTATKDNATEAFRFLNSLDYGGGTDLFNGVISSLEQFVSGRRQRYLVLLTDGRPSVGTLDSRVLKEAVVRANRYGARIFSMALGEMADTALLWQLSEFTKGATIHVHGGGQWADQINKFYEGITQPLVSNISINFKNVNQVEAIPSTIPDMSVEAATFVFGNYQLNHAEPLLVTVKARVRDRVLSISRSCNAEAPEKIRFYIPLIHAMRKTARTMEVERLSGLQMGTLESLRSLAQEYGFRVPPSGRYVGRDWGHLYWEYQTSMVPSQVESDGFRRVGEKLFRRIGTQWVDTKFNPNLVVHTVPFLSREYFDLIQNSPWLGQYLCMGQEVTVVVGDKAVKVVFAS